MNTFLPPLSRAEELKYFDRLRENDKDAKDKLILHNMRLVAHVVKKYAAPDENSEELISIGTIGLIKAVSTYDSRLGSRFATYAIRCIENEILMYFRSKKKARADVSLYEPIGTDKEGNQIMLVDILDNNQADVEQSIENKHLYIKLLNIMEKVLNERELFIIKNRYGIRNRELTQRQIAAILGISRSYVSRIEKRALSKLQREL